MIHIQREQERESLVVKRDLIEASLSGNVETLNTLIEEDPLILDRVTVGCFEENPLHIAALRGHLDFTRAILSLNANLATELDSFKRTALHSASDKGHLDVVRELLRVNTDVCLYHDNDGMIPLHLAVMKGHVGVIQQLIQARPDSIMVRQLKGGKTILHLCVKYNCLEALKWLMESGNAEELVNAKDDGGNTILHDAAALKQREIIKYLLSKPAINENVDAVNAKGRSALDLIEQPPSDSKDNDIQEDSNGAKEIQDILVEAGAQTRTKGQQILAMVKKNLELDHNWIEQAHGNFITAATLTATMAFQAAISPPGGFVDAVGTSILAKQNERNFSKFFTYNTVSFGISLSIILLMISGISFKSKLYRYTVIIAMSFTVLFLALSYLASLSMIMPEKKMQNKVQERKYWIYTFVTCFWVFEVILLVNAYRLFSWLVPWLRNYYAKRGKRNQGGRV